MFSGIWNRQLQHSTLVSREEHQVSIFAITRLYLQDKYNPETLLHALEVKALPEVWRNYFLEQLAQMAS